MTSAFVRLRYSRLIVRSVAQLGSRALVLGGVWRSVQRAL